VKCYYNFRRPLLSKNRFSNGETTSMFPSDFCDQVSGTERVVRFVFNSVKTFFKKKLSIKWDFSENQHRGDCSVHEG
jgi:hypothetical protein